MKKSLIASLAVACFVILYCSFAEPFPPTAPQSVGMPTATFDSDSNSLIDPDNGGLGADTSGVTGFLYVTAGVASGVTEVNTTEFKYLDGLDANIHSQLLNKQPLDADLTTLATATAWRVYYSSGTSAITALALGAAGTYLQSNGASAAPTWVTPAGTGDFLADGTIPMTGTFLPGPTGTLDIGSGTSEFHDIFSQGITISSGVTFPAASINGDDLDWTSGTTLPFLATATSDIQSQINGKQALDTDLTALAAISGTTGDMIYHSGTSWVVLDSGTSPYLLTSQGAAAPIWSNTIGGISITGGTANTIATWSSAGVLTSGATEILVPSSNADPTGTAGYMKHDSTVTNFLQGAMRWNSGTSIFHVVSMENTIAEACTNTQVVAYDSGTSQFICKNDADSAGTPTVITVADTADATSYVALFESAIGDLGPKTDSGVTYAADTGMLYATGFTGPLTGNASSATLAATSTIVDSTDSTSSVVLVDSATGSLALKTDSGVTYAADTGMLYTTGLTTSTLAVSGQASGGAKTYSVASGVTNATQLNDVTGVSTLLAAEVNGTLIGVDDSGVTRFTLPDPVSGYNVMFTMCVSGVTVQVESGTTMYVNGTATATGGVGAQITDVTVGEHIACWTINVPGAGEIEWTCRKVTD